MGYDQATLERVRLALSERKDVVEKRMVGGRSFMVRGHLCCGVTGDALMVRIGPEDYERALAEPHVRPMEFARKPLVGYVLVDPAGVETDEALAAWLGRAISFVSTLPPKRRQ